MIPSIEQRHAAGGRACPCFGGDSSSASTQTTNQTDNRRTIGQGAVSAESGATVTYQAMDAEVANNAITASGNDLKTALNYSDTVTGRAFGFASQAQATALDSLNTEANLVKDAYADAKGRGALTDKILIGSIVAMAVVAALPLRHGR